jgi:hypothetical protein
MCRITSISYYRNWKEARQRTSDFLQHRDVSSQQTFLLQGKTTKEIQAIPIETLGEDTISYAIVKNWVGQFKRGDFSTCVAHSPGRVKSGATTEFIDHIHELI